MQIIVPSYAKLNLDLRVLYKRTDGFHELRTIFQTISLKDTLAIRFERARRTGIDLDSSISIPDNLVVRAAKLVLDHLKVSGRIQLTLRKKIPMGAGLGGGSSNAAAVLTALPALIGKHISHPEMIRLGESLGSDVPFFLYGGTALGFGRGTELYPLVDLPSYPVLVIASGIHVSTAEAYRNLSRSLTLGSQSPILREFQMIAWDLDNSGLDQLPLANDFEDVVFEGHPQLMGFVRKLRRLGANPVRMTGSGSAVFGIFSNRNAARDAAARFPQEAAFPARFVSRRQYQNVWRKALGPAAMSSFFTNRGD